MNKTSGLCFNLTDLSGFGKQGTHDTQMMRELQRMTP